MATDSPFNPRTVAILIVFGVLSFAGATYFALTDTDPEQGGSNAFSTSAVGHLAFAELLQRRKIPVVISRNQSANKAGNGTLLVLAEPLPQFGPVDIADTTLLILPKRLAKVDPDRPSWVRDAPPREIRSVEQVLQQFVPDAAIVRHVTEIGWNQASRRAIQQWNPGRMDAEALWNRMRSRAAPQLDSTQLIQSPAIEPIIDSWEGTLVGVVKTKGKTLFIISDPDLLSNAGIGMADHAALMLDLIELMRPVDGKVILDEVIHGLQHTPSLWDALTKLPFAVVSVTALVALGILAWAASSRFGAPIPPPQRHAATESDLIENGVGLLYRAGHEREIAGTYPGIVLHDLSRRLHAPRTLAREDRAGWIDRLSAERQVQRTYSELAADIHAATSTNNAGNMRLLRAIQRLYDWKQELIDGPGRH